MKIKLTRGCIVPGHPTAQPGDVLDVRDDVGRDLLAIRKAVLAVVVESAPAAEPEPVAVIETREPAVETRDPEPVRPTRKKSKLA